MPTSSSCGGLVAFGCLEGPLGPPDHTPLITSCIEFFFVFFLPPFFIGGSPYTTPTAAPPTPCTEFFCFFLPHFCIGGPPCTPPPAPPLPLEQSKKKIIGDPPLYPPPPAPPLPLAQSIFYFFTHFFKTFFFYFFLYFFLLFFILFFTFFYFFFLFYFLSPTTPWRFLYLRETQTNVLRGLQRFWGGCKVLYLRETQANVCWLLVFSMPPETFYFFISELRAKVQDGCKDFGNNLGGVGVLTIWF